MARLLRTSRVDVGPPEIGALYERKPDPNEALAAYRKLEIDPGNAKRSRRSIG